MASIHLPKQPNGKTSRYWYAMFRIPNEDGSYRQVKRCTKKTTKAEARIAAQILEDEALREAGCGDANSKAILAKVKEAAELAVRGTLSPYEGRRLVSEMMALSGMGDLKCYTIEEWIETWMAAKKGTVSVATFSFYGTVTRALLRFLGNRSNAPLEGISTAELRKFRDSIAETRTARTANHYHVGVKALFSDAVKEHALLQNPTTPIRPLDESEQKRERAPFSRDEVARLIAFAPDIQWHGMILLGAFTGLRLGDCAKLTTDNLKGDRLSLVPSKSKKPVVIPLHPELVRFFEKNPPSPFPNTPLFPNICGKGPSGRSGLSSKFKSIMEKAEISTSVLKDGKQASRSFHSLRHSFVSWMANADVAPELRQKLSGHATESAHEIYTSIEMDTLSNAVSKIPSL